jgi:hypothetical protein
MFASRPLFSLIDLTKDPATDAAITNDGKSCHPVW